MLNTSYGLAREITSVTPPMLVDTTTHIELERFWETDYSGVIKPPFNASATASFRDPTPIFCKIEAM